MRIAYKIYIDKYLKCRYMLSCQICKNVLNITSIVKLINNVKQ